MTPCLLLGRYYEFPQCGIVKENLLLLLFFFFGSGGACRTGVRRVTVVKSVADIYTGRKPYQLCQGRLENQGMLQNLQVSGSSVVVFF
jgi:hypothetical protein